jgi:hypothetical protein
MKKLIVLTGLAAVLALSACEEGRNHSSQGGAAYEGTDRGYGYDSSKMDYPYDDNRPNQSPYEGYPNYYGYPHSY